MSVAQLCFILFVSSLSIVECAQGEPVVYFPPFELRAVRPVALPNGGNPLLQQPLEHPMQQAIEPLHHNTIEVNEPPTALNPGSHQPPHQTHEETNVEKNETVSVHKLLKALGINEKEHEKTEEHERAATGRDYEYPSYSRPPPDYGYPPRGPPSYWPQQPPAYYQDHSFAYVPPTYGQHSSPAPSKPFELITRPQKSPETHVAEKPLVSKVAGKVSGIIGLVMALLTGSTPDDLEIKGVKDLVINGIVKPLMLAKGGIKSLISKLSIPVIVLLLVNLELLVLIWWLWEDCQPAPVQHHQPPIYPYRPPSNYGYRPYRR